MIEVTEMSEVDFLIETERLRSAFIAAKEDRDLDWEGYKAAKAAWSEWRTFWREIRDCMASIRNRSDAIAAAEAIQATARGN